MSKDETFESAFTTIFRELLTGVCTALVGEVVTFDGKNRVSVQPAVKIKTVDGTELQLPIIADIPILFLGSSLFSVTWPVVPGDQVLLVCSQRDISNWKTSGGVVSPASSRRFSASDAIAIGGLSPLTTAPSVGTSFKIEGSAGGVVEIDATGTVTINGNLEVLP